MAAKKPAWTRITTKPGKALWPHLSSPDVTFNAKGVYHVKLVYTPEDFEELKAIIDAEVDKAYALAIDGLKPAQIKKVTKAYPYDDETDKEGEETGDIAVKFKSNASYEKKDGTIVDLKPALFDTSGQQIRRKINIGNGSILKVNTTIKPYYMKSTTSAGVTLYINGVQIKELTEYGASAESMGFDDDGEGFVDGGSPEQETFQEQEAGDGEGDF